MGTRRITRTRHPGLVAAATVLAASGIVGAVGVVGAAGASSTADNYEIRGLASSAVWEPPNRTIQTGDTVTWTFETGSVHNVQSDSPNWSFETEVPSTDPAPYTFTTPGVYQFTCIVHQSTMTGTVTVQDEEPTATPTTTATATPTATATAVPTTSPTPTPPAPRGDVHATPRPGGAADAVDPSVRGVRLTALRRAVRVRFRLSEPATVTIAVRRRGARRVLKSARVQARAGTRSVTLRSRKLKQGRYTVAIRARDAFGNRSGLSTRQLLIRR